MDIEDVKLVINTTSLSLQARTALLLIMDHGYDREMLLQQMGTQRLATIMHELSAVGVFKRRVSGGGKNNIQWRSVLDLTALQPK